MRVVRIDVGVGGDGVCFELPSGWDELSGDALLWVVELSEMGIGAEELKLRLMLRLCGGRVLGRGGDGVWLVRIGGYDLPLGGDVLCGVCDVLDFLFVRNGDGVRLEPRLTRNVFGRVRVWGRELVSVADGLTDLSYAEYAELQVACDAMVRGDGCLDDVVGLLYRRVDGVRDGWRVRRLPHGVKVVALWFYMGCVARLCELFPRTFSVGGGDGCVSVADGQMRVIDALAGGDVTKKMAVRDADLYEALYSMEMAAERYERVRGSGD